MKVANILIIQNGKILLLHSNKHKIPRVEPPGGRVELGESSEECALREAKEELDIDVKILDFFGKFYSISENGQKIDIYTFLGKIEKGEPKIMEPEGFPDFGWYFFEDLLKFKEKGSLAPNLVDGLDKIKELLN